MSQQSAARGDNLFDVVLRGALLPAAAAGLVTALVLTPFRGVAGLVAALVGVAIGLAFFASGLFVVGRFVRDNSQPALFMAVGMAVYFAQVMLLLGVLIVARRFESFDSVASGIALLVTVLVWQGAQMYAWRRARVPVYDEAPAADHPGDGRTS
jgi:ATP synthase protein I